MITKTTYIYYSPETNQLIEINNPKIKKNRFIWVAFKDTCYKIEIKLELIGVL